MGNEDMGNKDMGEASATRLTRRAAVSGGGASFAVGLVSPLFAQGRTIVTTALGGVFEREFRKAVVEPFSKETGVEVKIKLGSPGEWLTNALVNRRRPEIDLLFLPYPENIRAVMEGVCEPLTENDIPNLKNVYPVVLQQFKGFGTGMDYVANGIAYRIDIVDSPPKSWKDLWDPAYKGKLIIPDINAVGIWEMLVISARLHGGDEGKMDPAFEGIHALKPNVRKFYKSSVDLQQMLEAGEAGIAAVTPSNRGYDMVDSGKPIKFVIPTDGASVGMVSFHVAKNSKNSDICKQFINFALSKKPQEDFGNGMNAGPTTSYAVLNDKARSRVPPIESMLLFDWFKLVPQMGALADRWNREIAG
jgi:putative spermidine/putrescine transport system substrate-binding protein